MGHATGCWPHPQELRHLPKYGAGLHPKEALCDRWPMQDTGKTRLRSKPAVKGKKPAGPAQEAKELPQGPPDLGPVSLNSEWQLWEATPNRLLAPYWVPSARMAQAAQLGGRHRGCLGI